MANILILHGPNLNILGTREPEIYGSETLDALNNRLVEAAKPHRVDCFQSNAEHALVEKVQQSLEENIDAMIVNPAAFTHTSVALRDAIAAVSLPFIEVHISNVYAREPFRKTSYFSDMALAVITGCGVEGYFFALDYLKNKVR